ncbi:flagellar filament capping protein FliD [Moorella naiadis]|uniref:flagellar filament capping protein FliD n=1 Tax=Moorella naiadis (nom. illeg.) TaxID=3093670 RepID=UPI003D9C921F
MSGTMYISGLASGLNTDSIIQQLMDIERIPLVNLQQRQSTYETQKNAWQDIYTRLTSLQSKLGNLELATTFTSLKATSGNPAALTATVGTGAVAGSYQVGVIQLAQAYKVASVNQVTTDDTAALNLSGTFSITVGGQTRSVTVSATDSLQSISNLINALPPSGQTSPGAGDIVTASVVDHRLVITSKTSGAAGGITFSDPNKVLNSLGLVDTSGTVLAGAVVQAAQDAKFTVDGLAISRPTNTVSDVIAGVTLNLLGITDANKNGTIEAGETVSLQVANDTQPAVDAIQALVDQYNSVMDFISTKLGDKGDLQGDPTLAGIQSRLWQLMTGQVAGLTGNYQTPWSIGISTGPNVGDGALTFDRSGKITLDTTKLTAALTADPNAVANLFKNSGGTGLAEKLDSYIATLVRAGDGIITSQEQGIQNIIDDMNQQIAAMQDQLNAKEDQLRQQFTAMETALASLQSQGAWLSGQLAGLGAYQAK